ncbi:MAG: hypothetical protein IJ271_05600 [Bacteroidales bacterium]|nr:hypothetical protein [Bacteroidales bacterium]MBQ8049111.1 hypothetical protein [Bacteroidales bacterium]
MFTTKYHSKAILTASRKSLEFLIEETGNQIIALQTLAKVVDDTDAPIDRQVLEELDNLFTTANRMLHQEVANLDHIEQMQKSAKEARAAHKNIRASHTTNQSNQAHSATA